jgi:hypothetical protein
MVLLPAPIVQQDRRHPFLYYLEERKGGHVRTIPVPDCVKREIDDWCNLSGISTGKVFRCVCMAGKAWGNGISEQTVWHSVALVIHM